MASTIHALRDAKLGCDARLGRDAELERVVGERALVNAGAWVTVSTIPLLVLSYGAWPRGVWMAKPIAATGFLVSALQHGALLSTYGRWVLTALILSWLGDVLLIPRTPRTFLAGIGAFLLGHVAYVGAFVARGVEWLAVVAAFVVLALPFGVVVRWLMPKVSVRMKAPVVAYMIVITTMVALSIGTFITHQGERASAWILVGAFAFYFSDLSVARDRFVSPGIANKVWGTPLYFTAQLVFASTVVSTP